MNLRKISILLFGLIFLISTTSLPLTLHLCKMAEKASVEQCGKCKKENTKLGYSQNSLSNTHIKNASSPCCSEQIIDSSVKDNFISSKINVQDIQNMQFSVSIILAQEILNQQRELFWNGEIISPPKTFQNHIYILNSVFLI